MVTIGKENLEVECSVFWREQNGTVENLGWGEILIPEWWNLPEGRERVGDERLVNSLAESVERKCGTRVKRESRNRNCAESKN